MKTAQMISTVANPKWNNCRALNSYHDYSRILQTSQLNHRSNWLHFRKNSTAISWFQVLPLSLQQYDTFRLIHAHTLTHSYRDLFCGRMWRKKAGTLGENLGSGEASAASWTTSNRRRLSWSGDGADRRRLLSGPWAGSAGSEHRLSTILPFRFQSPWSESIKSSKEQ